MSIESREPISCKNCIAACCVESTVMALSNEEALFMMQSGTELLQLGPALDVPYSDVEMTGLDEGPLLKKVQELSRNTPAGHAPYMLTTDCGYLVDKDGWRQCGAHDDDRRPSICESFEEGSDNCQTMRFGRGVVDIVISPSRK